MKRRIGWAALLLALCLCLGSVAAYAAEELWSEEYYRAYDTTGELSEAERDDLSSYVNIFGYNARYGRQGSNIKGVRYYPQQFRNQMARPEQTLPHLFWAHCKGART